MMQVSTKIALLVAVMVQLFASRVHAGLRGAAPMRLQAQKLAAQKVVAEPTQAEITAADEETKEDSDSRGKEEDDDSSVPEVDGEHVGQALARIQKLGKKADHNGDRKLSLEEMWHFADEARVRERKTLTEEIFTKRDVNKDGFLIFDEVSEAASVTHLDVARQELVAQYEADKFAAVDADKDGKLGFDEFLIYLHPEAGTHEVALRVEVSYRMKLLDKNSDNEASLQEFLDEARRTDEDFHAEDVEADFVAHDQDKNGNLNASEFEELLKGHAQARGHIEKAIQAADEDGDGHIHLHNELPNHMAAILDNEFIEDHFLGDWHHDEL